jgi:hypothetical protein
MTLAEFCSQDMRYVRVLTSTGRQDDVGRCIALNVRLVTWVEHVAGLIFRIRFWNGHDLEVSVEDPNTWPS